MIFGVTHDAEGAPIKRATIGYKLSIGLPPTEGKNYPQRLDHFIVTVKTGAKGGWEEEKSFTAYLKNLYCPGDQLFRELDVVLLSDDPEEIFRTEYAWRTQTQLKCHGDGQDASRRLSKMHADDIRELTATGSKPNDWIEIGGCGKGCPQLEDKLCKPSGDLFFMFPERPVLGSVAMLHTSGWESVRRVSASLHEIKMMVEQHGGSLKGLRLKLVARPYKTSFTDDKNQRKSSVQLGFNLEFREADHRKLLPALVRQSLAAKKEMGDIEVEPLPEDEIDAALGSEFHPTAEQQQEQKAAETKVETEKEVTRSAQRPKILDHVASQAPKQEAKLTVADVKASLEAAKTVQEIDAAFAQAKTVPKAEKALEDFYKARRAILSGDPPANMPDGWKEAPAAQEDGKTARPPKPPKDII